MMTNEEVATEVEYLIQRGVSNDVAVVLYAILGAIKCNSVHIFAVRAADFAKYMRDILTKGMQP